MAVETTAGRPVATRARWPARGRPGTSGARPACTSRCSPSAAACSTAAAIACCPGRGVPPTARDGGLEQAAGPRGLAPLSARHRASLDGRTPSPGRRPPPQAPAEHRLNPTRGHDVLRCGSLAPRAAPPQPEGVRQRAGPFRDRATAPHLDVASYALGVLGEGGAPYRFEGATLLSARAAPTSWRALLSRGWTLPEVPPREGGVPGCCEVSSRLVPRRPHGAPRRGPGPTCACRRVPSARVPPRAPRRPCAPVDEVAAAVGAP